jgi:SagB-type dehydrogenase family enzyme
MTVEQALAERRSIREYAAESLTLEQVAQLLWAAYGVTRPIPNAPRLRGGLKTAPSAGGRYPLELYLVAGNVTGLEPGVYNYRPEKHELWQTVAGDRRPQVDNGQGMVEAAPATIVYSAVFERNTGKYGQRGRERYVCMDLGHSAENVYLQATALGLGTCAVGAFVDMDLKVACRMTRDEEPLYIMPVGRPAQ